MRRTPIHFIRVVSFAVLIVIGLSLMPRPAYASTLTVTTLADTGPGSLRQEIINAGSGDQIDFSVSGTITLESQLPLINKTLIIDGSTAPGGSITIVRDTLAPAFGLLQVTSGGDLTLDHLTLRAGSASVGGALFVQEGAVAINSSTISGNSAINGGAISTASSTLTVTDSTISGNSASAGGAISADGGTLKVTNSTFSGNSAVIGAGIYNFLDGIITITNSTFSGNSAGPMGGGIYNYIGGILTITNSTFSDNSAGPGGGGGIYNIGGTILNNSIIANSPSGGDCAGNPINASHSLIMDSTYACGVTNGVSGNIVGVNPKLGVLMGSPAYFPPLSGSPAIDKGDNTLIPSGITIDEAGRARIFNDIVDMGAYEFVSAALSGPPISSLCIDVTSLANGAITVSGGVQNVLLSGVYGNTYCRLIAHDGSYVTSPAEIGLQSVISLGVIDAVDVFGQLPGGESVVPFIAPVSVCLRGSGDVLFLSAADASRTPQHLAATSSGGFECVSVPNSGTVVLVGSASNIPPAPTAAPSDPASTTLDNCKVTTTHSPLNLRSEANTSATLIAQLPYNLTLTATAHQSGWYQVIYGSGQGWVSDQFVSAAGNCG